MCLTTGKTSNIDRGMSLPDDVALYVEDSLVDSPIACRGPYGGCEDVELLVVYGVAYEDEASRYRLDIRERGISYCC